MNYEMMDEILDIGIALTAEKDIVALLEKIMDYAMRIAQCDGGTLYLKDEDRLVFKLMCNKSLGIYQGFKGEEINIEPVPLDHEHVSSLALLEDRTFIVDDVYDSKVDKVFNGTKEYDKNLAYHTRSVLVVPMKNPSGEKIGVLQLINALNEKGEAIPFSKDIIRAVSSIASQAAIAIQNARYLKEIRELFESYVETSVQAIGKLTPFNENHTRNMVEYGKSFLDHLNRKAAEKGEEIPYPQKRYDELIMAIWLHDLGKLVTPVDIMNKNTRLWPMQKLTIYDRLEVFELKARIMALEGHITESEEKMIADRCKELKDFIEVADTQIIKDRAERLQKYENWTFIDENGHQERYLKEDEIAQLSVMYRTLTDEEFEIMHDHVVKTEELLSRMRFPADMSHVRDWAAMHHELLNGKGYPRHLQADQIPEEVRILTILDIYEALTASDREYKKPLSPKQAFEHLHKIAGFNEIDERLVDEFEESQCLKS